MSTPLTDGINALTQYANETTGKQDTTLSDAVGSLVEGYGQGGINWFKKISSLSYLFYQKELPEPLVLDFEGNTITRNCEGTFYYCTGSKNLTIKNLNINSNYMSYMFNSSELETITFENCSFAPTRVNRMFSCNYLKGVYGIEFDLSTVTSTLDLIYFSRALEDIRFKPNTIKGNFAVDGCIKLNAESLISIANGLDGSVQARVSGTSAPPVRLNTIMGTNDNGTFIADPNGTLTLADFITTVKGWTLS